MSRRTSRQSHQGSTTRPQGPDHDRGSCCGELDSRLDDAWYPGALDSVFSCRRVIRGSSIDRQLQFKQTLEGVHIRWQQGSLATERGTAPGIDTTGLYNSRPNSILSPEKLPTVLPAADDLSFWIRSSGRDGYPSP